MDIWKSFIAIPEGETIKKEISVALDEAFKTAGFESGSCLLYNYWYAVSVLNRVMSIEQTVNTYWIAIIKTVVISISNKQNNDLKKMLV